MASKQQKKEESCTENLEGLGNRSEGFKASLEQGTSSDLEPSRQFLAGSDIHNASQVDLPVRSEECPQSSLLSLLRRALYGSRLEARSIEVSKAERTRSFYSSTQEGNQEQGQITDHTSITTLAETTTTASSSRCGRRQRRYSGYSATPGSYQKLLWDCSDFELSKGDSNPGAERRIEPPPDTWASFQTWEGAKAGGALQTGSAKSQQRLAGLCLKSEEQRARAATENLSLLRTQVKHVASALRTDISVEEEGEAIPTLEEMQRMLGKIEETELIDDDEMQEDVEEELVADKAAEPVVALRAFRRAIPRSGKAASAASPPKGVKQTHLKQAVEKKEKGEKADGDPAEPK